MNSAHLQSLQDQLPPGWVLKSHVTQKGQGAEDVQMTAESDRLNLILVGRFDWILRRTVSYALSAKGGPSEKP